MTKVIVKAADGTGAVELFHDAAKKLETSSTGATVTGKVTADNISLPDDGELRFGDGDDLKIDWDGSRSLINSYSAGTFKIMSNGNQQFQSNNADMMIKAVKDGAVELYHDNSKKIETIATGVNVTGGVRLGGNNAVNELSDYEEGTWTLSFGGSGSNPTYNVLSNVGHYVKVGHLCTFYCRIQFNTWVDGTGSLQFKGLPFTSKNTANFYPGQILITYADGFEASTGDGVPYCGAIQPNSTMTYVTQSDSNATSIATDQVTTGYTNEWLISGHYYTES